VPFEKQGTVNNEQNMD